jgi:hypothetical protein
VKATGFRLSENALQKETNIPITRESGSDARLDTKMPPAPSQAVPELAKTECFGSLVSGVDLELHQVGIVLAAANDLVIFPLYQYLGR